MNDPSRDPLIEQAVEGDSAALSSLLAEVGAEVRRGLAGEIPARFQSLLDADDILQVTYLEAFLRIRQFAGQNRASLIRWLRTIAEHNLLDAIRGLSRWKRPEGRARIQSEIHAGNSKSMVFLERLGVTQSTPSQAVTQKEWEDLLRAALAELPADYRQVITLYDLQQKSSAETAAEMGRSRGAMHMLRSRAQDRLRELLGTASRFFTRD